MNQLVEDIDQLLELIGKNHPNQYNKYSEEYWNDEIKKIKDIFIDGNDITHILQFSRILAMLGDAHSRVSFGFKETEENNNKPKLINEDVINLEYPFHGYIFEDGYYAVWSSIPEILGKKIVKINNFTILEIAKKFMKYIPFENEYGFTAFFTYSLIRPLFYKGEGIIDNIDDEITIQFEDKTTIKVQPLNSSLNKLKSALEGRKTQIPWDSNSTNSIQIMDDQIYLSVRNVLDNEKMTMKGLANELDRLLESEKLKNANERVKRLIIDLRQNGGGNNYLTQDFIHKIIKHDWINKPSKLFCLIDRWTFSAAVNFANYLERETWTLFAGEPFSAKVNHYGDAEPFYLDNSGIEIYLSTLYWQDSDPDDKRNSITPDLFYTPSFAEIYNGEDVILQKIKEFEVSDEILAMYKEKYPRWKRYRSSQNSIYHGYMKELFI